MKGDIVDSFIAKSERRDLGNTSEKKPTCFKLKDNENFEPSLPIFSPP